MYFSVFYIYLFFRNSVFQAFGLWFRWTITAALNQISAAAELPTCVTPCVVNKGAFTSVICSTFDRFKSKVSTWLGPYRLSLLFCSASEFPMNIYPTYILTLPFRMRLHFCTAGKPTQAKLTVLLQIQCHIHAENLMKLSHLDHFQFIATANSVPYPRQKTWWSYRTWPPFNSIQLIRCIACHRAVRRWKSFGNSETFPVHLSWRHLMDLPQ